MKSLKTIIVAAGFITSFPAAYAQEIGRPAPPQVVDSLIGFTFTYQNVIRLEWDLDKDGLEDLRVYYRFRNTPQGAYTGKTFMYQQDLNNNGMYEENEKFRFNNK